MAPIGNTVRRRAITAALLKLMPLRRHPEIRLRKLSDSKGTAEMTNSSTGTTALVTGGNSGIGRATALALAQRGVHVVLTGRDAGRGEKVVAEIRAQGGTADFVAADLRDEAGARQLAKQAADLGGGHIDILVNNAGVFPFGPTHEATEEDFDKVFNLNVKVPFFLVAELAPKMAERRHGVIINVSTMVAEFGAAQMALYGSSKAALVLLTKSWAAEYGPAGVRVNAVSPGPTRTEGTAGMGEALDQLAAAAPSGRPGLPEEIASAIVYLASDEASFVHGAVLPVDGGRIAV
jgi:NAD(P)-dependent dehydrogenase (short-subunit alcohol dehydrogenase family)